MSQSTTRSYDVENHVIGSAASYSPGGSTNTSYTWGANAHPKMIGVTAGTDAAYWDGNTLLYTVANAGNGSVDDIKIGTDAEYTPNDSGYNDVTFYDRGADGSIAFCHNATGGSGGLGDGDVAIKETRYFSGGPSNPCGPYAYPSWGMQYPLNVAWSGSYAGGNVAVGNGWTIGELRADGINDGVNTIQGVRAYDPTAGQWTTPDAYQGDVHDPMSQKAFAWNNNNPVMYSDPSGYEGSCAGCQGMDPFAKPPQNTDGYVKVEAHIGPISVSVTVTGRSGTFVSMGGSVSKSGIKSAITALTQGKVSGGASAMAGVIQPVAGKTSGDVVKGLSLGASGGAAGIGAEVWGNKSGVAIGAGISTPGFTPISGSQGVKLVSPTQTTSGSASHSNNNL